MDLSVGAAPLVEAVASVLLALADLLDYATTKGRAAVSFFDQFDGQWSVATVALSIASILLVPLLLVRLLSRGLGR